jgi:hypothetical protein
MKTRNGVYYDLSKSVYKFTVPDTKIQFVFSSDLHMVKFEERYLNYRKQINQKFNARYRLEFNFKTFSDLLLYQTIETRGFLILVGGRRIWQIELGGETVTLKN